MATGVSNPRDGTNIPTDYEIPSCGIEDLDRALFNLFDKRLTFSVKVNNVPKKVPVVFSTGERFALTRRVPPVRDKNNALILPIIAIKKRKYIKSLLARLLVSVFCIFGLGMFISVFPFSSIIDALRRRKEIKLPTTASMPKYLKILFPVE